MTTDTRRISVRAVSVENSERDDQARVLQQRVKELNKALKTQYRRDNTELIGRLWATLKDTLIFNHGSLGAPALKLRHTNGKKRSSSITMVYMDLHRILRSVGIQLSERMARSLFRTASRGEKCMTLETFQTVLIAHTLGNTILTPMKMLELNRRRAKAWCGVFIEIIFNGCPRNKAFLVQTFNDKITQTLVINQLRPMLTQKILKQSHLDRLNDVPCCLSYSTFSTTCGELGIFCRHEKPLLRAIFVLARGCNARCSICGMKNSRSNNNRNSPRMMDGEEQHDMVIGQRVDFMRLLTCLTLLTSIDTDKDDKLRMLVDIHDDDDDRCLYVKQLYALVKNATSVAACVYRRCTGAALEGGTQVTDGGDSVIAEVDRQQCNRVFVALMRHLNRTTQTDFFSLEGRQQCLDGLPYNTYALVNSEELLRGLKQATDDDHTLSLLDHLIPVLAGAVSMRWLVAEGTPHAAIVKGINERHARQKQRKTMRHRLAGLARLNRTNAFKPDLCFIRKGLEHLGLISEGEEEKEERESTRRHPDSPSTSTTDSAIDSDPDWSQFETVFRESKTGGCQLQKPSDRHIENVQNMTKRWPSGGSTNVPSTLSTEMTTLRDVSSVTGLQMVTKLGRDRLALITDNRSHEPPQYLIQDDDEVPSGTSSARAVSRKAPDGEEASMFRSSKGRRGVGHRLSTARFRSAFSTQLSQSLRKHEALTEGNKQNPRGRRKSDVTILMDLLRPVHHDDKTPDTAEEVVSVGADVVLESDTLHVEPILEGRSRMGRSFYQREDYVYPYPDRYNRLIQSILSNPRSGNPANRVRDFMDVNGSKM